MTLYEVLKRYWGYDSFRPSQEEVIRSVLDKKDTLALLPTGGGKSICFQVPALVLPGVCIVISPLIALMRDQVESLKKRGIEAVAIVAGMKKSEIDILLNNCIYGKVKFLYLSPERAMSDLVRERIRAMNVNLFAVDEAHCISHWGYDFRPPYLHLKDLRAIHKEVPILALTATATERVVLDIQEKLCFTQSNVVRTSFERKNLSYVVAQEDNKLKKLRSVADNVAGAGIVYVRNRRETQAVSRFLNSVGIESGFYHAGLPAAQRSVIQQSWMDGLTRVIVATNAFGMGIDKPDVRFVIHLDMPESLEAYFQEAGRAGRDGLKSFAVCIYNEADKALLLKKFEQSFPSVEYIRKIYQCLGNYYQLAFGAGTGMSFDFDIADFCSRFNLDSVPTINALKFLEHDEYISLTETALLQSRVKIRVNAEELYRFQIQHASYDIFIKLLLRSYGGLFELYTPVRESDLARRLECPVDQVVRQLEKLNELGLIHYIRQSDSAQLLFLQARADAQQMRIDGKYIAERKEIVKNQIRAIFNYVSVTKCRSQLLLEYFNDTASRECGICDVCLERKKQHHTVSLQEKISLDIIRLLSADRLGLDELIRAVKHGSDKERVDTLRILLDAGKVKTDGINYYLGSTRS